MSLIGCSWVTRPDLEVCELPVAALGGDIFPDHKRFFPHLKGSVVLPNYPVSENWPRVA